ncbi:hypothetical protein CAEBREN_18042 [Caenorhabditis brenneri]|uniref:F-box domain-containing protein n=1 Tax=Caenorhabditis brenneri TaxID=135651 RepID=G0P058_CAEBE|nr:hypothetical protein CAEBREN_18042 [Caenorhabditis brenneri]
MEKSDFRKRLFCFDGKTLGEWYGYVKEWRASESQSSQPAQLSDLNESTIKLVLDCLPVKDRLNFRNTSTKLQNISDSHPLHCKELKLNICYDAACLRLDNLELMFDSVENTPRGKIIQRDHVKRALRRLKMILKIPELKLENVTIKVASCVNKDWQKEINIALASFNRFLESLPHKIHVENLRIQCANLEIMNLLLPFIAPKVLKSIEHTGLEVKGYGTTDDEGTKKIQDISMTDQWWKARELRMCHNFAYLINYFGSFGRFRLITLLPPFSRIQEVRLIKSILLKLSPRQILTMRISVTDFEEICEKYRYCMTIIQKDRHAVYKYFDEETFDIGLKLVGQEYYAKIRRRL